MSSYESHSLEFAEDELALLQETTGRSKPGEAVSFAARQFLRTALLKQLKDASGKVEFYLDWRPERFVK